MHFCPLFGTVVPELLYAVLLPFTILTGMSSQWKRGVEYYVLDVTPCSPVGFNQHIGWLLDGFLAHPSMLKMEPVRSCETSMNPYQTTRRHIPHHSSLFTQSYENLTQV